MAKYGTRIKKPLDIAADAIVELTFESQQPSRRQAVSEPIYPIEPANDGKYKPALIEAIDAIKFASIFMKSNYDTKHEPVFFKVGEFMSLKLHKICSKPGLAKRNTAT